MAVKNTLRIRFTFNRSSNASAESVNLRHKTDKFASIVVKDAAVEFAKGKYSNLRSQIRSDIEPIMKKELNHLARQYLQFIVGKQRIGGTITSSVKDSFVHTSGHRNPAESVQLRDVLPPWKALSKNYSKKDKPNWFKYKGTIDGSDISGVAWEQMFGPVSVSVQPAKNTGQGSSVIYRQGSTKVRVGVATIRATVFGQLTPSMVAALADGNMSKDRQTADGRTSGLLDKVYAKNPQLAWRLGHNSAPGHVYRPSLEPFLAFAVTRSIPAAVSAKLVQRGYK